MQIIINFLYWLFGEYTPNKNSAMLKAEQKRQRKLARNKSRKV